MTTCLVLVASLSTFYISVKILLEKNDDLELVLTLSLKPMSLLLIVNQNT